MTQPQTLSQAFNEIRQIQQQLINLSNIPVGTIWAFAGINPPNGWLLCDGSPMARTGQFANLFNIIGTIYGVGDDINTFNLPDLRGRTIIGSGNGAGLTNRIIANKGGNETHTLSVQEIPSHNHTTTNSGAHTHSFNMEFGAIAHPTFSPGSQYSQITNIANYPLKNLTAPDHTHDITNTGGGLAHNNMQPFVVLNYIIKY